MIPVSVIITTRNRAKSLEATLQSLANVHVPANFEPELLVVDNGSEDDTAGVVHASSVSNFRIRYMVEGRRGQSYARNAGLGASSGDYILFIDDDVRPGRDWLEGMCRPMLNGEAQAVAGGVYLAPYLQRPWMEQFHRDRLACTEWVRVESPESMVGANMAFSRAVLTKVPAFDVELGPGALGFYDESLFSWQILEAGYTIAAALDVAVEHHVQEDRLLRSHYIGTAWNYGRSLAYIAHHWKHEEIPDVRRQWARAKVKLAYHRIRRRRGRPAAEGIPMWEGLDIQEIAFYTHYPRERRRPRHYALRGLTRLAG